METSLVESIEKSAVVTKSGKHDITTRNHLNGDTAGYIGATEVVAKVAEVSDYRAEEAVKVAELAGG